MAILALVLGRILLAIIFIVSGVTKLQTLGQTGATMTAAGLPASLAMPTGVFELVAGAALAVGVLPRIVPLLLAGFTLLTILYFHANVSDPMQAIQAMKNIAIIGGLLAVLAANHQRLSYRVVQAAPLRDDRLRSERLERDDRLDRDERLERAEERAHGAEMRAARMEAVSDPVDRHPVRRPWFRRWF